MNRIAKVIIDLPLVLQRWDLADGRDLLQMSNDAEWSQYRAHSSPEWHADFRVNNNKGEKSSITLFLFRSNGDMR